MSTMVLRKIVEIDESLCNGCGLCIVDCHENAIEIRDGVAKVIKDSLCDGLGACIGACPTGALTIVERLAEPFAEPEPMAVAPSPCGCPSAKVRPAVSMKSSAGTGPGHWPLKLHLVPPDAHFLRDADVVLAADCAAFHDPSFHSKYANGIPLMIICPKFSDYGQMVDKLKAVFSRSGMRSCRIVRMEVPCCSALVSAAKEALRATGSDIPVYEDIVKIFT